MATRIGRGLTAALLIVGGASLATPANATAVAVHCAPPDPSSVEEGTISTLHTDCWSDDDVEPELRVVDQPTLGSVVVEGDTFRYTADPQDDDAVDSFSYVAFVGEVESEPVTQQVEITPRGLHAPMASIRLTSRSPQEAARTGLALHLRAKEDIRMRLRLTVPERAARRIGLGEAWTTTLRLDLAAARHQLLVGLPRRVERVFAEAASVPLVIRSRTTNGDRERAWTRQREVLD